MLCASCLGNSYFYFHGSLVKLYYERGCAENLHFWSEPQKLDKKLLGFTSFFLLYKVTYFCSKTISILVATMILIIATMIFSVFAKIDVVVWSGMMYGFNGWFSVLQETEGCAIIPRSLSIKKGLWQRETTTQYKGIKNLIQPCLSAKHHASRQ